MLRNQYGSLVVFFPFILAVSMGLGALVIDMSQAYSLKSRVKNAIDLSSIAGISQLTNQSNIDSAKNTALQYLNNNLTKTIPSFTPLTLSSNGLSIQAGIYDFNSMTFTWDETNPNVNALMISYKYNSRSFLANYFMIANITVFDQATAAKISANRAQRGTGFPLIIKSSALSTVANNMLDLYSATSSDNSLWTDYTNSNPSTTSVRDILNYFQYGTGTPSPQLTVNDAIYTTNDGGMAGIFMDMNPNILVGMQYILPLVTQTTSNKSTVDGFVGATISAIKNTGNNRSVTITIVPGFLDNHFGGLQVTGTGTTNIGVSNQNYLADSFRLVQ